MNIIINIFLLFIFIYGTTLIGIPGLMHDNLILNKLYIFIGIFLFQLIFDLIENTKNIKQKKLSEIIKDSVSIAIISVIGYSIYLDLLQMNSTHNIMSNITSTKYINSAILSGIISIFVFIIKIIELFIDESNNQV